MPPDTLTLIPMDDDDQPASVHDSPRSLELQTSLVTIRAIKTEG